MAHPTAVVILNWNTRHFLEKFLPDIVRFTKDVADIVVVDNGSTDDSVAFLQNNFFTGVNIIRLKENTGFTGGYNAALKQLKNEYFMLLNSDVRVTENWLSPLVKLMDENRNAGACQPKILSYANPELFEYAGAAGGFIDKYGYPFCRGRILNSLEKDLHQYDDSRKVFWVTGACMLVRSSVFNMLDGFDPNFFAHMEEIDLCWRMQLAGYFVCYCGESHVYHVGGGSLPKNNPRKTFLNFRNNLLMIHKNFNPTKARRVLRIRLVLDLLASIKFLFSGSFADFKAVWLARRSFNDLKHRYSRPAPREENKNNFSTFFIYPKSVLWDYYLCGRKKFSSLNWKLSGKSDFQL